ncbi:MAG: CDP-alcohol phosphatidyltransferase family protein [Parachlamydiaceae bacterium]|nr:CDP-alcohol phosphatidyltransferase family protein [Parachlamydiaceae bacterium]
MLTVPNLITLLRLPLALVFLQENIFYRALALVMAMISDALDGYIARRYGETSRLGTLLDPLMDKFFVLFVLGIFYFEQRLQLWEASTMLSRDFAIILFGLYLFATKALGKYQFRAILCGKITTLLQFSVLLALTFQITIPWIFYLSFIFLGLLALCELYFEQDSAAS